MGTVGEEEPLEGQHKMTRSIPNFEGRNLAWLEALDGLLDQFIGKCGSKGDFVMVWFHHLLY